jgi:hypothetical protein
MATKDHAKADQVGAFVRFVKGRGRVVSTYFGAINIRYPEGFVLSIVEKTPQMTALSLSAPSLFQTTRFHHGPILPGEGVDHEEKVLRMGRLCLDLNGGARWSGIIRLEHVRGFSRNKLSPVKESLLTKGKKGGLVGLVGNEAALNPFAHWAWDRLKAGPAEGHEQPRLRGLSKLVGLGPGLTPSGDDFVTGALAGERIRQILWGTPCGFPIIDRQEIRSSLPKTSDAGKTLLWQALHGHFPCYLLEALKGFAKAWGYRETGEVMSRAVAHGETSGTDTLAGLVWYLENFIET